MGEGYRTQYFSRLHTPENYFDGPCVVTTNPMVRIRHMSAALLPFVRWEFGCVSKKTVAVMARPADAVSGWGGKGILPDDLKRQLIAALPKLRRYARALTRSVPEADDLVQDVCTKVLARPHLWNPDQPLDRWLFRIASNHWVSEVRKRTVRLGQGHESAEESLELSTIESGETNVIHNELRHRVIGLPSELSSVLLLISVEGYTYAEAADLLDIPLGTVMSRVHRARRTLAKLLADPDGAGQ